MRLILPSHTFATVVIALVAGLGFSSARMAADPSRLVAGDDFESSRIQLLAFSSPGPGTPGSPADVAASIVRRADTDGGNVLELSGRFTSGVLAGEAPAQFGATLSPAVQPDGKSPDADPGAYTISFDIALIHGSPLKSIQLNIIGTDTQTGGVLHFDLRQAKVGGGFVRVSCTLDKQSELAAYPARLFNPGSGTWQLQFQISTGCLAEGNNVSDGKNDTIVQIDNIRVTVAP